MEDYHVKVSIATLLALAMAASVSSPASRAQQRNAKPTTTPFTPRVLHFHPRKQPMATADMELVRSQAAAAQTIPLWSYSTVAQDGQTYTGSMVRSLATVIASTIPTYLVQ
jgi:hypothetical protein